jgi:hypothetical protein
VVGCFIIGLDSCCEALYQLGERYDWPMTVVADINNHALRIVCRNGKTETLAGGPDKKGYNGPEHRFGWLDSDCRGERGYIRLYVSHNGLSSP